jgi:uroporphyrinogen-III synthase
MLDERLEGGGDVRAKVASLGEGTSAAYERWSGRRSDLLPRSFTTEGLARAFPRGEGRVLCARADIAPDGLEDALTAKGWTPTRVDAYRTVFPNTLPRAATAALAEGTIDAITFTSASTGRGFLNALGTTTVAGKPKIVCIGPVTARQARDAGLPVHAVADPHTTDGLITALERALRPRRRAGRG